MARMIGAPIVHGAICGPLVSNTPYFPGFKWRSEFLGEAQIVDGAGNILARRSAEEGEGVILATITPGAVAPTRVIEDRFWTFPPDPAARAIDVMWSTLNGHARRYYHRMKRRGVFKPIPAAPA
ncbi:MAG: hypothetical protein ACT4UQ_02360 [Gammaproteobacteria bacterium]